ncbi:hypothetical protein D3C87_1665770 [compost metagenome]
MDHHDHLVLLEAERLGGFRVEHLLDPLDLEEMVARPERPELPLAAVLGLFAHQAGLGLRQAAALLAARQVGREGETAREGPGHALAQHRLELRR